ncbi:BON domain-containing protein [Maribacter sp. ACAM166]|uniref:BON domain-containing protein n=1 Tax=Maribacter sp. ACAM166 TaxID=2508996 RepID=UPI0010FD2FE6|nr:BON domain-containing protein [Maribacter sp. ACAM166]TLP81743.1 BON domain-containing protein [Maribacter sp. ACAM166]
MKTDAQIKQDVLDELAWQPNIDETEIGVTVKDGIVNLSGTVNNYSKKIAAEKAVKSVDGVKAVAENIEVKRGHAYKKTDKEIAKAVVDALEWNASVPEENLTVKVEDGWVYLNGEVEWGYQRNGARQAVENLLGVKNVLNNISLLHNTIKLDEVRDKIKNSFEISVGIDINGIAISTDGYTVTLKGKVNSLKDKEDAETAAYRAPGVYNVKNELKVNIPRHKLK